MEQTREGSPYNACSTLLSMDCQIMDQQSASKPSTHGTSLQQGSLHKISTSCVSSNINDDHAEREEQMEKNTHNGMLQGSMIFDMLSAMQFNSHSTINTIQEQANNNNFLNIIPPSSQKPNLSSNMSPDHGISSPWHLNLYNNNARAIDTPYQGHMDSSFLSPKDTILQSAPPSGFDPIASFLKLPVLADQTKIGLADQRLISSYSSYISHNKEDPYAATQGYSTTSNNNWITSLQLESIRDCSNVNTDTIEDEGHVVQYLDHNNIEAASEEAKLLMKLNVEHATMSNSHDNIGSHEERERVLNESYNSSSMHMLSNYHNEEQLLYTLNEGGDIEGGHGSGSMLDNMHMMMGYNSDPRANVQFGVLKGGASSSVLGPGNVKTTRKRGVRGSGKNSEERENQRMTHIAVERNRRRQMNEHLRVLRALMPPSYIQRGDQASIIGGAIEFVRELEQLLQCLESQKRRRIMVNPVNVMPQPATIQQPGLLNTQAAAYIGAPDHHLQLQAPPICMLDDGGLQNMQEEVAQAKSAVADIEVKVVEKSEALIKILSQRRPRQLLHTIQALQDHLHLSILHTNVTTIDNTVLYSFTVKIHNDRDCSANHIATLVHGIFIDIINQTPIKEF